MQSNKNVAAVQVQIRLGNQELHKAAGALSITISPRSQILSGPGQNPLITGNYSGLLPGTSPRAVASIGRVKWFSWRVWCITAQ